MKFNGFKGSISKMANTHHSLVLTNGIGWDDFSAFVDEFVKNFSFKKVSNADSVDVRLWEIDKDEVRIRIVYDDYENEICLESDTAEGDRLVENTLADIKARLNKTEY